MIKDATIPTMLQFTKVNREYIKDTSFLMYFDKKQFTVVGDVWKKYL